MTARVPVLAEEKSKSTVAPAPRVIVPTASVVPLPLFGSIAKVLTVRALRLRPVTVCVVPPEAPISLNVPPPSTSEEAALKEPPLAALRASVPALTVVAPV